MLVPMSWLKDYVDISDIDIKTFVDKMTMTGSAVESYEQLGKNIEKVVVGKILEIREHPNADKLVVCKVDVGKELQIVTGAPNIKEGDLVPVALVGAKLPGGIKIKDTKLRDVKSTGMMCSIEELGLSKEEIKDAPDYGIYVFNKSYEIGEDVKPIFGLDDTTVEFEITSNRADCFSVIGIAREVAASFDKEFKYNKPEFNETDKSTKDYIKVNIKDKEKCNRYTARVVENIEIKESPDWLKKRLLAAGIGPINNIVDITNYILVEYGQPLHAFDLSKIEENEIIVRTAKKDEEIKCLDGIDRRLNEDTLVIADSKKPLAIAGIMGGESSKITNKTQTIVIESASFNETNIRHSSKKLGLRTDASSKYEKEIDPNITEQAINRAAELIEKLANGKVYSGIVDEYPNVRKESKVKYDVDKINKLLGSNISEDEMLEIFSKLGFTVKEKEVIVPTYRNDVKLLADLAEEVIRIYGYENIAETLPKGNVTLGEKTKKQLFKDNLKSFLIHQGLHEIMTYSFESPKVFEKLNIEKDDELRSTVNISNPLGSDFSIMRTSTINGMLKKISSNYNMKNKDINLFEFGKIYQKVKDEKLPNEKIKVTIASCEYDYFDLKGIIDGLAEKFNINLKYKRKSERPYYHPGKSADIISDNKVIGEIAEIHPNVLENYNLSDEAVVISVLDFNELFNSMKKMIKYKALPKYPAMNRDLALVVSKDVLVGEIKEVIESTDTNIIENIELFDVYTGDQIEEDKKSVAYSIQFRNPKRTLTEDEVNDIMEKIINSLKTKLNAKLRG